MVRVEAHDPVLLVTIDRPETKNAIDVATATALTAAFERLEADESLRVGVLTGAGGTFCSGADLKAVAGGSAGRVEPGSDGPLGPTRRLLAKPVIAAVEGHAVAGGLELALWCDLRVAGRGAVFGVYCRRFGVPLVDGGTVRLSRLIGHSRALDMILTGRAVDAEEALAFGLANRVVPEGSALDAAVELALQIAAFPQLCMRADRRSSYEQWGLGLAEALRMEAAGGLEVIRSGETLEGARRFASGEGRHGAVVS